MIDQTFGKWTVLEEVQLTQQYLCKCECGYIGLVYISNIKKNHSKQCKNCYLNAMVPEMIGKKFGGPYSKENCRWVTPKENSNNRRRSV